MTRDQKAAEVVAILRQCQVSPDGVHRLQRVNPFEAPSEKNFVFCARCLLADFDL